jgi:hypothetical protein
MKLLQVYLVSLHLRRGIFSTFDNVVPVQARSSANSTNATNAFGGGSVTRPTVVSGVSTMGPGGCYIRIGIQVDTVNEYFNPVGGESSASSAYPSKLSKKREALCSISS